MSFTANPGRVAFQYPNFRYFTAARFLIVVAAEMQSVAVGWQLYDITRRPLDLGLAGLAQFLPGLLLFLFAGQLADRVPRKRILMVCFAAFALCSALLYMTSHFAEPRARVAAIYVVLVLIGVVRAFNAPTAQAFTPLLVPQEHFPNAVAWNATTFEAATILGPALGGVIYALARHASAVYLIAATCFLVALAAMTQIHIVTPQKPRGNIDAGNLLTGFRYVFQNKIVLGAISLDLFAVLLGGAVALLPIFAREILKAGPIGLGLLRSAPGAGALITAVIVAHWPLKRRAGRAMLFCVACFGVFTIVFGLSRSIALSLAALFFAGGADMISVIVRATMVQLATPDEMRGRVSAVNMLFIGASNEFGQFESGLTAQWFGTVPAVVLGGIGTLIVVAAWAALFPQLRRVDKLSREHLELPAEPSIAADPNE